MYFPWSSLRKDILCQKQKILASYALKMHEIQEWDDWILSTYQHQQLPCHPALGLSVQNQQVHTLEMAQLHVGNKSKMYFKSFNNHGPLSNKFSLKHAWNTKCKQHAKLQCTRYLQQIGWDTSHSSQTTIYSGRKLWTLKELEFGKTFLI